MANDAIGRQDQGYQGGPIEGINAYGNSGGFSSYEQLPYEDPAVVNPQELATFPKQVNRDSIYHHHSHHHHHEHVRDGRQITRTDNHPDFDGYI